MQTYLGIQIFRFYFVHPLHPPMVFLGQLIRFSKSLGTSTWPMISCFDLKYCHDSFSEPLINMFWLADSFFQTTETSSYTVVNLKSLIESQKLWCSICLSLSFQVLPEYFHNCIKSLMFQLSRYLQSFAIPELVEVVNDLQSDISSLSSTYL